MLDDAGRVTASDYVNLPSHWFADPEDVELVRLEDWAYEFLASQGVPLGYARAATSFNEVKPPNSRFYVSPPGSRPMLVIAVYDPGRRMAFERPNMGAPPGAVRAIIAKHLREIYEDPSSIGGVTRDWIWALMDSRGNFLTAGREPNPAENDHERARILEARYPGIVIDNSLRVGIPGSAGQPLNGRDGTPLMLTVYWLEPTSPLP
jgi:hypothetical protein